MPLHICCMRSLMRWERITTGATTRIQHGFGRQPVHSCAASHVDNCIGKQVGQMLRVRYNDMSHPSKEQEVVPRSRQRHDFLFFSLKTTYKDYCLMTVGALSLSSWWDFSSSS